jgi:hypothetical protein
MQALRNMRQESDHFSISFEPANLPGTCPKGAPETNITETESPSHSPLAGQMETERWEPFLRMLRNSRVKNNRCRAFFPVVWFSQRFWADLGYVLDNTEFLGRSVSFQLMQTRSGNSWCSSLASNKRTSSSFIWLPSNDYPIPLRFSVLFLLYHFSMLQSPQRLSAFKCRLA